MVARWRIVNQEQREDLDRTGKFSTIMEITFEVLDTGNIGMVKVPISAYSAERVADEVSGRANEMLRVARLGQE
jgi:hypothetical protein